LLNGLDGLNGLNGVFFYKQRDRILIRTRMGMEVMKQKLNINSPGRDQKFDFENDISRFTIMRQRAGVLRYEMRMPKRALPLEDSKENLQSPR